MCHAGIYLRASSNAPASATQLQLEGMNRQDMCQFEPLCEMYMAKRIRVMAALSMMDALDLGTNS